MEELDSTLVREFNLRLAERLAALRQTIHDEEAGARSEHTGEVMDFKDMADIESLAAIDDMQATHASRELGEVLAALRRISQHTYGKCVGCGEPIDVSRLRAVPTAAYCTACQADNERRGST